MSDPKIEWEVYRSYVYKGRLRPKQEKECSNAFYAGICQGLHTADDLAALPEDEAVKALQNYAKKAEVYAKAQNPLGDN